MGLYSPMKRAEPEAIPVLFFIEKLRKILEQGRWIM